MQPKPWTLERLQEWCVPEPNNGCWLWLGRCNAKGYGCATVASKTIKAHRLAYELSTGSAPPPDRRIHVMHRCDVPSCVNPDHLRLGTAKENCRDMFAKGRANIEARRRLHQGASNHNAKLTDDLVRAIRAEYAVTGVQKPLCAKYGIAPMTVNGIVHGRRWKHVK